MLFRQYLHKTSLLNQKTLKKCAKQIKGNSRRNNLISESGYFYEVINYE